MLCARRTSIDPPTPHPFPVDTITCIIDSCEFLMVADGGLFVIRLAKHLRRPAGRATLINHRLIGSVLAEALSPFRVGPFQDSSVEKCIRN